MSTEYLKRVLRGEMPSAQEWQDHLIAFHASFPDIGDAIFTHFRDELGRSSYERLLSALLLNHRDARDILDVGSGSGTLLRIAHERLPHTRLVGIDLSESDLAHARERVPSAEFVHADAMALPFAGGAFDLAASHLTLMVVPDVARAFREMRRVLRDHGRLCFVVDDPLDPLMAKRFGGVLQRIAQDHPRFLPRPFADPSIYREDALHAMLRDAGFRGAPRTERFVVSNTLDPHALWTFVERTYLIGMLEEPTLGKLREYVLESDAESLVEIPVRLTVVEA